MEGREGEGEVMIGRSRDEAGNKGGEREGRKR